MVTLKACIIMKDMRKDGTWRVVIRLTYKRKSRMIPTTMYVSREDITASGNIRNQQVIDECERLIRTYQKRIRELNLESNDLPIEVIRRRITIKDPGENIDFIAFCREWIEQECNPKSRPAYTCALNSFLKFLEGMSLSCNHMSRRLMLQYEQWLTERNVESTHYCVAIKHMFCQARAYYNDNEEGKTYIKRTLDFYYPTRYHKDIGKRALTIDQIRAIAQIPDEGTHNSIRDLARDVFLISFMMMGTNAVDLWGCEYDKDGNITYERAKVRDIRADRARIVIRPHPLLKPYLEKYAHPNAPDDRHVFSFCCRYKDHHSFSHVVNMGLKAVGEAIGIEGLNYYAARHSMATIALNEVLIDKLSVHEMLNHRMPKFRVTDMYIHRDFDRINRMNFRLIEHVFGKVLPAGENSGDRLLLSQTLQPLEDGEIRFRYRINPDAPNLDRTWNVIIQVSVGAQSREIKSSIKVCQRDINTDYNIKNPTLIERCNDLLDKCRKKTAGIGGGSGVPDIDTVIRKLVSR
jgi:integrase